MTYVAIIVAPETQVFSSAIAAELRRAGVQSNLVVGRPVKTQLKLADKSGAALALFVRPDGLALKDMRTGVQIDIERAYVVQEVRAALLDGVVSPDHATYHPEWRVHTANLIDEALTNPGTAILKVPFTIMCGLLAKVGERAAVLNDPELNKLMCQLTIYEIADPTSDGYDPDRVREVMETT